MEYQKVKSVSKVINTRNKHLNSLVLKTMKVCSDLVGATLGPGGMPVLIESQEFGYAPKVTKDGVTVFKSIGFDDATAHVIMEAMRDASIRTANEAGDGTTTATVLAEAIGRLTHEYLEKHKTESPQKVMHALQIAFDEVIEPMVKKAKKVPDLSTDEGKQQLWTVAKISANGDEELATAVLACFDQIGDEGNVTIQEISGKGGYEVERIEGFPIPMGYEDSCAKYVMKFINDPGNQRTVLENPLFCVYHGRITDIQTAVMLLEKIGEAWQSDEGFNHNVVLIATGFSDSVLGQLAINFAEMTSINVFPLLAPMTGAPNSQFGFLQDICAYTGATLADPLNKPLDQLEIHELGKAKTFEVSRFRSLIIGNQDDENVADLINQQVDILTQQKLQAASIADAAQMDERIGKLTGGIAKLKVVGASNGDLRERRDRAEDAVCAVRGAIKEGFLPGGGWMLWQLAATLEKAGDPVWTMLADALLEPLNRILSNCGLSVEEHDQVFAELEKTNKVYNAAEKTFVDPYTGGVLDSTPAVLNAIRNSLSIAKLLGLLGGTSCFKRDLALERKEASETSSFLRDANYAENPADERAT